MFKVMDHFDDIRDEKWDTLKKGAKSDMGNVMPIAYREMFRYLLDNDKTECCEPGKTFILDFQHDDIVGQMRFAWLKYRIPMCKMMRFIANQVNQKNDNYLGMDGEPDDKDIYTMSTTWFFLPFEMFSPEFKALRAETEVSMDEYGTFAVTCWCSALNKYKQYKSLHDEIAEYFYEGI